MRIETSPKKLLQKFHRLIEEARPIRPSNELFAQAKPFADFLSPEDSFSWPCPGFEKEVTVFLMKEGALGVGLWLSPIAHEILSESEISLRLQGLSDVLSRIKNPDVSLQIIFDAEPDTLSSRPDFASDLFENKNRFANVIAQKRFDFLSEFASNPKHGLRLFKRRILLTLRVAGDLPSANKGNRFLDSSEQEAAERSFAKRTATVTECLANLNGCLLAAGFAPQNMNREELLFFLRDTLHANSMRIISKERHQLPSKSNASLSSQVLYHSVQMTPYGLGCGEDSWQAASLLDLPESTTTGLLAKLLALKVPHRIVVNIRPVVKTNDLDTKRYLLKNAEDAYGLRQVEDISAAQTRMTREEGLIAFSFHLLVRTEGKNEGKNEGNIAPRNQTLERCADSGLLRSVLSEVTSILGCQFIEESLCAPLVFASCLPFQNAPEVMALVGRESRALAQNLVALLPVFGGFKGTQTPMVQMISRGGERIYLNPRDANGASHMAVLGGSGAGKSFSIANLVVAFMATHPKSRVFIIDKKTSYAPLAWLAAEEGGATFLNPPQNFPNIFEGVIQNSTIGQIDEDRLPSIVNLLQTAIALLSPKSDLSATHTRALSDALRLTFEEKSRQSGSRFDKETGHVVSSISKQSQLPRLSEVVNNLPAACDALQFAPQIATQLVELLSPYVGQGPYAKFFDAVGIVESKSTPPLLTLCDLDGVAGDPVLLVLSVQAVILEILRLVKPALDASGNMIPNPPSLLIIEEVGVLSAESPALVTFIRDAWKTMRKFGVTCVGVTNEVSDYTEKPGPKEIWNVSPNKLILTQNPSAIAEMETRIREGKNGLVPSLYHCELLKSLKMVKGAYADAFWMGENTQGSFVYVPTGFDTWCAASDPIELATLKQVAAEVSKKSADNSGTQKTMFQTVSALATLFPQGVRGPSGLRSLTEQEKTRVVIFALTLSNSEQNFISDCNESAELCGVRG